jgi:hypothetical protein
MAGGSHQLVLTGTKIAMLPRTNAQMEPGENAGAAQAGLPLRTGTSAAAPALPRRNAGIRLPAPPASATCPPVEPGLLRRVLDGLKKL